MDDISTRPVQGLIKKAFEEFVDPESSRERLKDAALAGKLYPVPSDDVDVAGRGIAWKIFLISREPLDSAPVDAGALLETLRSYRRQYAGLLLQHLRAPDGSYEDSASCLPGSGARANIPNLETNNPLSLHNENPWRKWFESVELRKMILQDVERTFPDIPFFRDPSIQTRLTEILFIYSVTNPSIGYRQGMHELLAPLYYAVGYDSVPCPENENATVLQQICSKNWIAADSWALFSTVMKGVSRWYEWREGLDRPSSHLHIDVSSGQAQLKPYVAPIIQVCNHIQANLLRAVDPVLWEHMQTQGVEPQIYGIRWLRLLFTREFDLPNAMKLWDGLFAADPTVQIAPWICVAMLIRIRNQLLSADYSGQLALLLHYPGLSPSPPTEEFQAPLLVKQALALQLTPKPATGATVMLENHGLLDIPVEITTSQRGPRTRHSHLPRNKSASTSFSGSIGVGNRQQQTMSIPEMVARGLLERGESLGINKTVMNAVTELRKSMPDLTGSFSRSPPLASSFPLMAERQVVERPPWEPRTRFEIEREMAQLRSNNKRLGDALGWVVDVMLQDESDVHDLERLLGQRREALESLAYVRDALMGHVDELEDERLFGEEELLRRRKRVELMSRPPEVHVDVAAPAPASVIDSRSRLSMNRKAASQPPSATTTGRRPRGTEAQGPALAPWNYTRSNFSVSNGGLRVPPASVGEDPLGVVSRAGPEITGL